MDDMPERLSYVLDAIYAAFGQATYSITDDFRVTGGLRYSKERKIVYGQAGVNLVRPNPIPERGRITRPDHAEGTLAGAVASGWERSLASDLAGTVKGVTDVENDLDV